MAYLPRLLTSPFFLPLSGLIIGRHCLSSTGGAFHCRFSLQVAPFRHEGLAELLNSTQAHHFQVLGAYRWFLPNSKSIHKDCFAFLVKPKIIDVKVIMIYMLHTYIHTHKYINTYIYAYIHGNNELIYNICGSSSLTKRKK